MVEFSNRRGPSVSPPSPVLMDATAAVRLKSETFQEARAAAPGWDVYYLETRWRTWMAEGDIDPPRDADKAFIGYCRKHFERNGEP
ncbi:MAG: plasmid replication initiator RepA, partial [Sphingorhabdus sp.]